MIKDNLIKRIDQLLEQGQNVLSTKEYSSDFVEMGLQIGFRAASLSFIKNVYGEFHPYFKEFNEHVNSRG